MLAAEARGRCSLLDHTGDAGLRIRAASLPALYEAALLGLVEVLVDASTVRLRDERRLAIDAADRELLLVGLLRETLALYEVERWLWGAAEVELGAGATSLRARLSGESFDPARHAIRTEIKAVTYHALAIGGHEGDFEATVVLDL